MAVAVVVVADPADRRIGDLGANFMKWSAPNAARQRPCRLSRPGIARFTAAIAFGRNKERLKTVQRQYRSPRLGDAERLLGLRALGDRLKSSTLDCDEFIP